MASGADQELLVLRVNALPLLRPAKRQEVVHLSWNRPNIGKYYFIV